jgi:hypothetical protein
LESLAARIGAENIRHAEGFAENACRAGAEIRRSADSFVDSRHNAEIFCWNRPLCRFFADFGRCEDSFAEIARSEDFFAEIRRCEDRFAGFCRN